MTSDDDRAALAEALRRVQSRRFGGVAKRAYDAAGVNSATWTRATGGQSIKPHTQRQIILAFWPESEGDLPSALAEQPRDENPRLSEATMDQLLDEISERRIGRPSRGQQARRDHDRAGDAPVDDPNDMEPR